MNDIIKIIEKIKENKSSDPKRYALFELNLGNKTQQYKFNYGNPFDLLKVMLSLPNQIDVGSLMSGSGIDIFRNTAELSQSIEFLINKQHLHVLNDDKDPYIISDLRTFNCHFSQHRQEMLFVTFAYMYHSILPYMDMLFFSK